MAQLLAVVALIFAEVTGLVLASIFIFFHFLPWFYLEDVDSNSYGEACLMSLIHSIVTVFPLPIFAGFLRDFGFILRRLGFPKPSFWFLSSGILDWRALSIRFNGCEAIALGIGLIDLTGVEIKLKTALYLGLDRFFNYLIKVMQLPAVLFYFYLHRGFQTSSEVLNHYVFFEGSV